MVYRPPFFKFLTNSSIFIYLGAILLLIIWWGLAFRSFGLIATWQKDLQEISHNIEVEDSPLFSFDRESLKKALAGDFQLIGRFIQEWDIDAQYLQAKGVSGIRRLTEDTLLQSQLLKRKFAKARVATEKGRYLPQTYMAASFLLAIASPEEIVALPGGFRCQTALYSTAITDLVPLTIDRHHSEALFLSQPDLAFIAPYSNPSTVEALKNQGIQLFCTDSLDTVEDIPLILCDIGKAVGHFEEAQLLAIFINSALLAIDNRLLDYKSMDDLSKMLYVSYHSSFSLPTKKNLSGQLLIRLGMMAHMEKLQPYAAHQQWSIPIDQEKIVNFKPDCLIISSDNIQGLKARVEGDPAFEGLRRACGRIIYVDDGVINSPTQYIALAYYDLAQALLQK